MDNPVLISLQIEEEQRERWHRFAENTDEFLSMSELIRTAVNSMIEEEEDESESKEAELPALDSDIQDLKDQLSEVRKDVDWLRRQEQDDRDINELAHEVFESLEKLPRPAVFEEEDEHEIPPDVDQEEYHLHRAAEMAITPSNPDDAEERKRIPQTAPAIAERLDDKPKRVQDAIEHLESQHLPIVEVELNGEVHYFERGDSQ